MSHAVQVAPAGRAAPSCPPRVLPVPAEASTTDQRIEVALDEVVFRRVHGAADLRRVAHLRDAIALPAGVRDAPAFARLEKKGTSRGS
jgi:hypothetical protein